MTLREQNTQASASVPINQMMFKLKSLTKKQKLLPPANEVVGR